jgi:hypothetical protein
MLPFQPSTYKMQKNSSLELLVAYVIAESLVYSKCDNIKRHQNEGLVTPLILMPPKMSAPLPTVDFSYSSSTLSKTADTSSPHILRTRCSLGS